LVESTGEKQAGLAQIARGEQPMANHERHFHWDGSAGDRATQWLALPT
jgi:hypothetical protein